jgi:hypothetical protein
VGLERGLLSLVNTIEELLGRKSSGSCLESRHYCHRDPSSYPRGTLYPQKLALTSPTSTLATECVVCFEMINGWVAVVLGRKPVPISLCSPQSPHGKYYLNLNIFDKQTINRSISQSCVKQLSAASTVRIRMYVLLLLIVQRCHSDSLQAQYMKQSSYSLLNLEDEALSWLCSGFPCGATSTLKDVSGYLNTEIAQTLH